MKNSLGKVYQRRNLEIEYLKVQRHSSVQELIQQFKVSRTTIDRDLALLNKKQYIIREYGKIHWIGSIHQEPQIIGQSAGQQQKQIVDIAKNYSQIFVNASPITNNLIAQLIKIPRITIITNIIPNQSLNSNDSVIYLGGNFRKNKNYTFFVGDLVLRGLKYYHAQAAFIYATGINHKMFTTQTLEQSLIDRTMVENSDVSYFWESNFVLQQNNGNFMIVKRRDNTYVI